MNDKLKEVLEERGSVYGPYGMGVELRAAVMNHITTCYQNYHDTPMTSVHQGYFWDIVNKLVRVAVTPDHEDTWQDVAGYATRILEDIQKRKGEL